MKDTRHVRGLSELAKVLDTLPDKIERNIMRSALRAGAKTLEAEAKLRAPVGPPTTHNEVKYGGYAGALRDSIRVTTAVKNGRVTASVRAGGKSGSAEVYYAGWVEYGTAAHRITGRDDKPLFFNGRLFTAVDHPGAAPHPFMRPALDAGATAAVVAVGQQIQARLTKQGLETPDVEVAAA